MYTWVNYKIENFEKSKKPSWFDNLPWNTVPKYTVFENFIYFLIKNLKKNSYYSFTKDIIQSITIS